MTSQPQLDFDGAQALSAARMDPRLRELLASSGLTEREKEVLRLVASRGSAQPIRAREIAAALGLPAGGDWRREVTKTIEWLVQCGAPIGASRVAPCGYFWIATPADQQLAAGALRNELKALARRYRRITGQRLTAALFRQIELELEKEAGSRRPAASGEKTSEVA
jgi:ATP/maltotriose-dependent transcriptional regulator MalT